jgi:peroxiredoxin
MGRRLGLALAVGLLSACANRAPQPDPYDYDYGESAQSQSKLTRYTFDDVDGNGETGESLPGADEAELIDGQGQVRRLSEFHGKPVVLVFTRGFVGFICPYCSTYTAQIATRYAELTAAGAEVVLVFPSQDDSEGRRGEFVAAVEEILAEEGAEALPFPVFLDPGLRTTTQFNLLGDLSKPATFVLDAEGLVRYAYVGRAPDERPTVDRILRELQALN